MAYKNLFYISLMALALSILTAGCGEDKSPELSPTPGLLEPITPIDDGDNQDEGDIDEVITICHKPDTPAEQTMEVEEDALEGHLNHGDFEGECPL